MPVSRFRLLRVFAIWIVLSPFVLFAEDAAKSLAQAEIAFARSASENGIKQAFLANLADDSVLFRPRAVAGKQWMSDHPANPGVLIWEPAYAEVSGAGDLGFTTGPYSYLKSPGESPSGFGQFFSIWKKQSDQSWKVFLDAGIESDKEIPRTPLVTKSGSGSLISDEELGKEQQSMLDADAKFSRAMYIQNAIRLFQKDYGNACSFKPDASGISKSGDLGYVYGTFQCGQKAGIYVRMWQKEGTWKAALDYRND